MTISRQITLSLAVCTALLLAGPAVAESPVSINPPSAPVAAATADVKLTVAFAHSSVTPPASVTLTLIVTNTGSMAATAVKIDNSLPVEFAYHDPAAVKKLATLGNLAPGDTISKTLVINVPAGVKTNRYVNEAIASAANADPIQADAPIDVNNGQVLGATDRTLAETGPGLWDVLMLVFGLIIMISGVITAGSLASRKTVER